MLDADEDLEANDSSPDYTPSDDESEDDDMPAPRRRAPPNRRAPSNRPAPPNRRAPADRRARTNRRAPANRPAQVPRNLPAVLPRLDRATLIHTAIGHRNQNHPALGQEPWGLPALRTVYPANFPQKLRELISLIPFQAGRIGQNIRPLIVETFVTNFTDDTLGIIAAVLSLVPRRTLVNFALVIAHVARKLFNVRPDDRIAHDGSDHHSALLTREDYWSHVVAWLASMRDYQVQTLFGLPFTLESLPHQFLYHTTFVSRPRAEQRIGILFAGCSCLPAVVAAATGTRARFLDPFNFGVPPAVAPGPGVVEVRRTIQHVQAFIASLPVVPKRELVGNEDCSICLEAYYRPAPGGLLARTMNSLTSLGGTTSGLELNEQPLKLPCGHVFGKDCLSITFAPKDRVETQHSSCPMCRARLDIVGVGGGR